MYIKKAVIKDIRAINNFELTFPAPAGWHVIIGDNGAGKSTVVRSLALALVGPTEALGLRASWNDWLNNQAVNGEIALHLESSDQDRHSGRQAKLKNQWIPNIIQFHTNIIVSSWSQPHYRTVDLSAPKDLKPDPFKYNWGHGAGWFSVAYGPFRRFEGGNPEWTKLFYSQPKLGAHLSVFGEDVALTEAIDWLVKLNYQVLEQKEEGDIIEDIKKLINSPDFLPHQAKLENISSDGVEFRDGNGSIIQVNQLSDGYRSILSLTFELIRRMIRVYGSDAVFKNIRKDKMAIDLPGVVLIDEIDAHLHPSWQTRIGQWFTSYFPNIQFIVTTHSPLVCRACDKGSIWRLAAPGSDSESGEITGNERDRLIVGNILDAYGTELFGKSPVRSDRSQDKLARLGKLNMLSAFGKIGEEEEKERQYLQSILTTDAPAN
jgi:predicted ATPase